MKRLNSYSYELINCNSEDEWLKKRCIGGTDASAILGANPHESRIELYGKLTNSLPKKSISNDYIDRGKELEPLIRKMFAVDYKDTYKVISPPKGNWIYRRKDKPYLTASLDGKLISKKDKSVGILEIKTVNLIYGKDTLEIEQWEEGTIPQHYYIQVLHYGLVLQASFAVLVARLRYLKYNGSELKQDRAVIRDYYIDLLDEGKKKELDYLEKKETEFYQDYVLKKVIPPITVFNDERK